MNDYKDEETYPGPDVMNDCVVIVVVHPQLFWLTKGTGSRKPRASIVTREPRGDGAWQGGPDIRVFPRVADIIEKQ